jgi:hypothetical protein
MKRIAMLSLLTLTTLIPLAPGLAQAADLTVTNNSKFCYLLKFNLRITLPPPYYKMQILPNETLSLNTMGKIYSVNWKRGGNKPGDNRCPGYDSSLTGMMGFGKDLNCLKVVIEPTSTGGNVLPHFCQ